MGKTLRGWPREAHKSAMPRHFRKPSRFRPEINRGCRGGGRSLPARADADRILRGPSDGHPRASLGFAPPDLGRAGQGWRCGRVYWNIMLTDSLRWIRLIAWPSRLATESTVMFGEHLARGERDRVGDDDPG